MAIPPPPLFFFAKNRTLSAWTNWWQVSNALEGKLQTSDAGRYVIGILMGRVHMSFFRVVEAPLFAPKPSQRPNIKKQIPQHKNFVHVNTRYFLCMDRESLINYCCRHRPRSQRIVTKRYRFLQRVGNRRKPSLCQHSHLLCYGTSLPGGWGLTASGIVSPEFFPSSLSPRVTASLISLELQRQGLVSRVFLLAFLHY